MIKLSKIHLQIGRKTLLEDTDLSVFPGQKWGLIGANGTGKTSLFKLLLGEIQEDKGCYSRPKDWEIAHMGQEVTASGQSALDYILDGDRELRELENRIEECRNDEKLAELYGEMERIHGYSATARARRLLHGLGFKTGQETAPVKEFSGGWRIRLNLARALMCRSDCLLLDEPTNHLDLDATIWLENWLANYRGTLLIISHDRDFLDKAVDNIVNIEHGSLTCYVGNYSAYEKQRAARLAQQASAFKKQQQRINEIESFVRRFRAKATKAKQAQSRLKELERMELIAPAHIDSPFSFRFSSPDTLPSSLVNLRDAAIGYSNETVLAAAIDLNILASSRLGLLGSNGAGKSTLIKTLAARLPLLQGERHDADQVKIGYFAQHQLEALDLHASCAQHLQRLAPQACEQEIRNFLGAFGFSGERAFESIGHFSGGEKARLALAIIAWQRPNLLLLDEPTNHLDLEMRHALTLALQEFNGAIVLVSHDRHLLKNTVDNFLLVDQQRVQNFDGDLDDYQRWLMDKSAGTTARENGFSPATERSDKDKKGRRRAAAAARERVKPLSQAVKKLEMEIDTLQSELQVIEKKLTDGDIYAGSADDLESLLKNQARLRSILEEKEAAWLEKSEALERLSQPE